MTYKKKLIKFVEIKASNLHKSSSIKYIDEEDIKEINYWSINICSYIYKFIVKHINSNTPSSPHAQTCPWCIYHFRIKSYINCNNCKYGKRHGICDNPNSTYEKLLKMDAFLVLNKHMYKRIIKNIEYED